MFHCCELIAAMPSILTIARVCRSIAAWAEWQGPAGANHSKGSRSRLACRPISRICCLLRVLRAMYWPSYLTSMTCPKAPEPRTPIFCRSDSLTSCRASHCAQTESSRAL